MGTNSKTLDFIDIFKEMPQCIKGVPGVEITDSLELFSKKIKQEYSRVNGFIDEQAVKDFERYGKNTSGRYILFSTTSNRIVIDATVKYASSLQKVTLVAASGFDLYQKSNNKYYHKTILFPNASKIWQEIVCDANEEYMLYLPLYDWVEELKIGAVDGKIEPCFDKYSYSRPIAFYGNSVTQGASASRAGNAFCNIVSRKLNAEIVNYSVSSYCKGNISVAEIIGKYNFGAIVIDYSRNAYSDHTFALTYDKFYRELRKYHPNIPIVLLTPINLSKQKGYYGFNDVIRKTYNDAIERNEKTVLIDIDNLFDEMEADLITVDTCHLTDYGMYKVANAIVNTLTGLLE